LSRARTPSLPSSQRTADGGEHTPAVLGDWPVAYEDSAQRPSTITHRLPNPNTSISAPVCRQTWPTCDSVSTRGNTARWMP